MSELNLILLGPPGAGKGTQADKLKDDFGLPYIGTGDLLRKHKADETPLGLEAKSYMDNGDLVPDGLVIKMILEEIEDKGADGFLLKGVPADDLQRAVRAVAAGDSWLDPAVTGRVLTAYRDGAPAPAPPSELGRLTPREREVLVLIGSGLSNGEIAAELVLGEGTVKTHVGHVFAKLGLRDRAAAVVFAFDAGLVSPGPR